jgi:dolichol-phosphate mannosyltransferase
VVRAGYRVAEVPITFVERERGESKMSGAIVREALLHITRWGIAYRGRQLAGLLRRDPTPATPSGS